MVVFLGRVPVRASGAVPWLPAQCVGVEDLVSGHGRVEFGEGLWPARRTELVVGQPVHHRGDAPADAPGQLQPGRSDPDQTRALHEYRQSRFQDREPDRPGGLAADRAWLCRCDAEGLAPDRTVRRRRDRHPVLPDDGRLAAGPTILFHVAVLSDDGADASRRLRSASCRAGRHLGLARRCRRPDVAVASGVSDRSAGLRQ